MAIPNDCGEIVAGSFHVVVSGAPASFFEKYGDLADRTNLCNRNETLDVVTIMSAVSGSFLVSNDVRCEASGCRGSDDFE